VRLLLRGVIAQAESNSRKAVSILALHRERRDWIVGATRSQYAVRALDWMFIRPIFKTPDLSLRRTSLAYGTRDCARIA
jgi:hypothetical protein